MVVAKLGDALAKVGADQIWLAKLSLAKVGVGHGQSSIGQSWHHEYETDLNDSRVRGSIKNTMLNQERGAESGGRG